MGRRPLNVRSLNTTSEKIYYIDNDGRVYKGFKDYLDNNTLPKCTMVYPKDGKYQMNLVSFKHRKHPRKNGEFITDVWLEHRQSPADNLASKVLKGGDIATTIISFASLGVGIAAMFTPIGPIAAIAGGVGGAIGSTWTVGRSAQHLADRGLHDETINPIENRSVMGAWIGIAGGAVGFVASGSTALVSRAIRTGTTIGRAATVAYDAVLIGNLVVNGVGLSFKGYDMYASYMESKQISAVDVVMLATHLFFFGNSVMNIRFARTIIESSQAQLLKDYEASLRSNRHRNEFQRMARNTRAAGTNDISSNEEIIRGINKISNKDDFFQAMVRNRECLSASSARAAFSDGKVTVNDVLIIDPIEFANLPREVRTEIIRNVVNPQTGSNIHSPGISNASSGLNPPNSASKSANSAGIKPNYVTGTQPKEFREAKPNLVKSKVEMEIRPNETSYRKFDTTNRTVLKEFCTRHANSMMQAAPPHIADFSNVLTELRSVVNYAQIFTILLEIGYKIWESLPQDRKITIGEVLRKIVEFVWNYVKTCIKRRIPKIPIDDPALCKFLIPIIQKLSIMVEEEIDVWVEAFIKWLEKKCPQTF
ncbi:uncharacterized protein [Venturia canescens]|uniref:uncharacterized protein isoform X2 n=1 Tax=Venturia canescens TaxID=32260 RepID=UPI001C9C452F|nr:uncharacterized protein LOC122414286 isoform X2 [Venturia canescens]